MPVRFCLLSLMLAILLCGAARGQFSAPPADRADDDKKPAEAAEPPVKPIAQGQPHRAKVDELPAPELPEAARTPDGGGVLQCRRGMVIKAEGGGFRDIVGSMAIPADLPGEQKVRVVNEDLPRGATVRYKTLEDFTRQMVIAMPSLTAGKEVRAVVTFEVEVLPPAAIPPDAAEFTVPATAKTDRKLAQYLAPSPLIESNNAAVRGLADEIAGDKAGTWEKLRAIHAWVYENIKFEMPKELGRQGCPKTIEKRSGVCAEKNSLAVALLRASQIPARMVRVASTAKFEHCYYEFCLAGKDGTETWFAGDASATAALQPRLGSQGHVILQKGDNLLVQNPKGKTKSKQRFLETTLSGMPRSPNAQLKLEMIGQ